MPRLLVAIAWLLLGGQCYSSCWETTGFSVVQESDRLLILIDEHQVAEFVFDDPKIARPYFANLGLPNGLNVTRNHPPVEGTDATDHASMHPGIWLGFGDINGHDFWRNKARMRHVQFAVEPICQVGNLHFATVCELQTADGEALCQLTNRYRLSLHPNGWLLVWEATFQADVGAIVFGDQEEMGFGARVATAITEKNGGRILNSEGLHSAARTWGQAALWCDYSGLIGEKSVGITLMASPSNFRKSWWHNRDYGVFVANPFGRQAMKQGEPSKVVVDQGDSLTLRFGALIHGELDAVTPVHSGMLDELTTDLLH